MGDCPEDYCVLWKPVYDNSGPKGQQHSCALLWHSVHCDSPLAPWVMKGLINESIRVSVCCSLCVSGMQSGPDVPSLRAHRGKGCHCWQAWWMGGTPRHDKDECDSPRPAKGGRCSTTEGRSRDADHLPFLVTSPTSWAQGGGRTRGKKEEKDEEKESESDDPIEWLPLPFFPHIGPQKHIQLCTSGMKSTEWCQSMQYIYFPWSKWWEITNTSLNWVQYLIKALDKITGLNKHEGIHQ